MIGEKQHMRFEESDIIDILVNWKDPRTGEPNLNHFCHILYPPEEDMGVYPYNGVYVAKEVSRKEFGLDIGKDILPGDFDILIIPFEDDKVFYSQTCVYEVKVARPSNRKPNSFSKTDGFEQINGLIRDGFPYISLMYVTTSEPVPRDEMSYLDLCITPANSGIPPILDLNGDLASVPLAYDGLDWYSKDNQMRKMMSLPFPRFVGFKSIGIGMDLENEVIMSNTSLLYKSFQMGYRNFDERNVNKMVKKIARHHEEFSDRYQKINWIYR